MIQINDRVNSVTAVFVNLAVDVFNLEVLVIFDAVVNVCFFINFYFIYLFIFYTPILMTMTDELIDDLINAAPQRKETPGTDPRNVISPDNRTSRNRARTSGSSQSQRNFNPLIFKLPIITR